MSTSMMAAGEDAQPTAIPKRWPTCSPTMGFGTDRSALWAQLERKLWLIYLLSLRPSPSIIHNIMNPLIEVDGDHARAEWHAIVATTMPGGQAFWTLGRYRNEYQRTADGWKYSSMTFEAAAVTSYEKGWGVEQFLGAENSVAVTER